MLQNRLVKLLNSFDESIIIIVTVSSSILLQQLFYWQINMLKKENISKDKTSANQITTATMLFIVMRTL